MLVRAAGDGASRANVSEKTQHRAGCNSAVCNKAHHHFEPEEMFVTGSQASGRKSGKSQEFSTTHSDAFDSRKMKRDTCHSWLWFRGHKEHLPQTTGETC